VVVDTATPPEATTLETLKHLIRFNATG